MSLLISNSSPSQLNFADLPHARQILAAPDDFTRRTGRLERSARMDLAEPPDLNTFLDFLAGCAMPFSEEDHQKVQTAVKIMRPLLAKLPLPLPEEITLVKTSGIEEGHSAYTRGTSVIVCPRKLAYPARDLAALLVHEFFHIMSRLNPTLRDQLYAIIGYQPCGEVELPGWLFDRRVTNPDAPISAHAIQVQVQGRQSLAAPVIYLDPEISPPWPEGFFKAIRSRWLEVMPAEGRAHPVMAAGGMPRRYEPAELTGFFEQIGRNTDYILHPEETLASNFAFLIMGEESLPNPEILVKMAGVFETYARRKES